MYELSNTKNIDKLFVERIIKSVHKPKPGRLGVTTLIYPAIQQHLKLKYWDQLTEDVSERLWALFGTGFHAEMSKYLSEGVLKEVKLLAKINDITVVGVVDIFDLLRKCIDDFKVTSVWGVIFEPIKPDHTKQLNLYNLLGVINNLPKAEKLRIHFIMKDWSAREALLDEKYPQCLIRTQEHPVWDLGQTEMFLQERVREHYLPPAEMPVCSPEDRWHKPDKYAVMKDKQKRAKKVCDSQADAQAWIANTKKNEGMRIEHRPGENMKCKSYCSVRNVCPFNEYNQNKEKFSV